MAFTYEAKGDGNCAFNAFALYLADAAQNGDFDGSDQIANIRQQNLLTLFKEAKIIGKEDQWDALKEYIKKQTTKEQLAALQVALAKALRPQSITLVDKPGSQTYQDYINRTTQALLAAYEDYKKHGVKKDVKNDDIFRRHDFIAKKFAAFKDKPANESEIKTWWANEGVAHFLEAMAKDGVHAGDAELVPLAYHFGLDFKYARKNDNPVTLTQFSFGEIPLDKFDELKLPDDFSFKNENELISDKTALLRYLTNAGIIAGKPSEDKTPYRILVQNDTELRERLKLSNDKNNKNCPDIVVNAFVELWQKHVKPTDIKSITLRNDYAAHWNYEADRESAWLAPIKIAVTAKLPESTTPPKKLSQLQSFYYDVLKDHVKGLKIAEPDANGRIEITGKLNNQAFDLAVTQTSVTTKSTQPEALKLLVEVTAKRIAEDELPKSVSMDVSDVASMQVVIAECKKHDITISNLAEIQKKIAEQEAAKKTEQAKPAAPAMDPMKMLEQLGRRPAPHA